VRENSQMARHEAFGHKLPLSAADYERMTALLARDTSPRGLRNAALLAVWYDSLLRIEDLCGPRGGQEFVQGGSG
jgi:hypothetical protein